MSDTQRLLPRSVHIDGRDSVFLGEPWSDVRTRAERLADGRYRILGKAAGPFKGATTVSVRANLHGLISTITLDYPPTDYAEVVAYLSRELGKPTMHDTISLPNSPGLQDELVVWENRVTNLALWRSNLVAGGFAVQATLRDDRLGP